MTEGSKGIGRRIRRYFFTGLVVLAPVGLTVGVLVWGFQLLDGILGGLVAERIGFAVPGLGVATLLLAIIVIGWAVRQAAGKQLLQWWNVALSRFPLTGRIYHSTSQIVQAVIGEKKRMFQRPVLVPYPEEGMWAVGFVTHDHPPDLTGTGQDYVHVFLPTTPNPTSGFMLIVPLARTRPLAVSIEEAMKLVISAGAVAPAPDVTGARVRKGLDLDYLLRDTSEFPNP